MVATPEMLETGIVQAVAQLMLAYAFLAGPAIPSAPSAPAPARVPRQLPPEAAAFVDRVHHFQRLSALLAAPDDRRAFWRRQRAGGRGQDQLRRARRARRA